jgi:hypothetical protein
LRILCQVSIAFNGGNGYTVIKGYEKIEVFFMENMQSDLVKMIRSKAVWMKRSLIFFERKMAVRMYSGEL